MKATFTFKSGKTLTITADPAELEELYKNFIKTKAVWFDISAPNYKTAINVESVELLQVE